MKQKDKTSRPYEESINERLKNQKYAIGYLNSILEENDPDLLLLGLRDVARARGLASLSRMTGLNREGLIRPNKGKNPRLITIMDALTAVGCKIKLEPIPIKKYKEAM